VHYAPHLAASGPFNHLQRSDSGALRRLQLQAGVVNLGKALKGYAHWPLSSHHSLRRVFHRSD
jgi:hypothetical protein